MSVALGYVWFAVFTGRGAHATAALQLFRVSNAKIASS